MSDGLFQPLATGDIADDDPARTEEVGAHIQSNPGRPPIDPDITVRYEEEPPIPTRLPAETRSLTTAFSLPQRIAAPDPQRQSLHLDFRGTAATDSILISDDIDLVGGAMASFRLYSATPIDILGHTGPVYIGTPTSDGTITFYAVTGGKDKK